MFFKGDRCQSPKCAMVKKNYPPGLHGPKGRKRQTDYGLQLAEKQKAKKQYNLSEKQFRLTFEKARKQLGNTGETLLKLLELRLDNVVYRLGFASSRSQARQLVNHGHFMVNNKRADIPSLKVKSGDMIKVKGKSKNSKSLKNLAETLKKQEVPGWLNLDAKELSGKVLHEPVMKDISINTNVQMIIEFYSR